MSFFMLTFTQREEEGLKTRQEGLLFSAFHLEIKKVTSESILGGSGWTRPGEGTFTHPPLLHLTPTPVQSQDDGKEI